MRNKQASRLDRAMPAWQEVVKIQGMTCPECGAEMVHARVRRLRGCLGIFGTVCLWGGMIVALIGGLLIWGGSEMSAAADRPAYEAALADLEKVQGGPWPFVEEFRENKSIAEETLRGIPEPPQQQVRGILEALRRRVRPTGCAPLSGLGGLLVGGAGLAVLVSGFLGLALGLLLTLKKGVWRCTSCGETF